MIRTGFRALLAFAVIALIVLAVNTPITGQNIGFGGRWPSDAGPNITKYATATDTTAQTILTVAQQGTGVFGYLYWAQCVSTSATVAVAIIKSGTTTMAVVPCPVSSTYGAPIRFNPPLKLTNSNTAATIEASTSITTAYFMTSIRTARGN